MSGSGKKSENDKYIRLDHRGKYTRFSRTGGFAVRAQDKIGGATVTWNSKYGIRASAKVAKGLRVANQSGRWQLIGRWSSGPFRYNLSKRGTSVSIANKAGAYNLTNPNRSSFKGGGINIRGKRAAQFQLAYLAIVAFVKVVEVAIWICVFPVLLTLDILRRRKAAAPDDQI